MPASHPLIKTSEKPNVLIAGAGLGGLTLAILLEKAGIPYVVYDRMTEVKRLGAALSLGWNIAPLFKQIGIWDDFISISKEVDVMETYHEDRTRDFALPNKFAAEMGGSKAYLVTRSEIYDLLLRQVPAEKILMGKRVLSLQQNEHGVRIQFSDGSSADGDILVGADGAYSAVRQSLFQTLKKDGKLPATDDGALPFSCVCLVGQTKPLDPAKYPELLEPCSKLVSVLGEGKPYSWLSMTMNDNIYCWTVMHYLDKESSKDNDSFRNSEWGPEAADSMSKEVRDFQLPGGLNNNMTLGDLIDETPLISKVMLEEKVFDTWYHKRTVLLGDACHKIHPAGAAGAINAMHDAVALANWISVLDSTSLEDVDNIFKDYKAERYPAAVASFTAAQALTKISGTDLKAKMVRFVTRNMPDWLFKLALKSVVVQRPQVSFLPLIKDEGTLAPKFQPSLQKTLAIRESKGLTVLSV